MVLPPDHAFLSGLQGELPPPPPKGATDGLEDLIRPVISTPDSAENILPLDTKAVKTPDDEMPEAPADTKKTP